MVEEVLVCSSTFIFFFLDLVNRDDINNYDEEEEKQMKLRLIKIDRSFSFDLQLLLLFLFQFIATFFLLLSYPSPLKQFIYKTHCQVTDILIAFNL